jgi:hypothetical protein
MFTTVLVVATGSCAEAQTHVFDPVVAGLHRDAGISLRLPRFLPYDNDPTHPLYANVLPGSKGSYEVEIGWTPDCIGRNYCHYGTVYGSEKSILLNEGRRIAVKLAHGVHGTFVASTCGASCDDATISWSQNGYFYAVGLKAGSLRELRRVVNSAIEGLDYKPGTAGGH